MKIITLSNKKKVGNFSSPHSFKFEDESILPAVSNEESNRLKVTFIEDEDDAGDVILSFRLSGEIWIEMNKWRDLWIEGEVNIVFCPLPMIKALNEADYGVKDSPFRSIRIEDRIKKLVSIHKQCI